MRLLEARAHPRRGEAALAALRSLQGLLLREPGLVEQRLNLQREGAETVGDGTGWVGLKACSVAPAARTRDCSSSMEAMSCAACFALTSIRISS